MEHGGSNALTTSLVFNYPSDQWDLLFSSVDTFLACPSLSASSAELSPREQFVKSGTQIPTQNFEHSIW